MTKTIKIIIGIIVAVIIIGGIWYGVIRKPGEKEVIKIGAIWHLTGPMSGIGEIFRNGALFAIDEINAKGGINGKKIILEIEDGQSDVKNSVSAFVKLVDVIGIKYIHSHGSAMSLALKPLVEEKKVLLFVNASHPEITEDTLFILRHSNIATFDAKVLVEEIKRKSFSKIGLIYQNDDWGVIFSQEFHKLLQEFNLPIEIRSESHLVGETDFRTQITKIIKHNPGAVLIATFGSSAGFVIKQLKEMGYTGDIFMNIGFALTPDAQKIAGEAARGIYYQTMKEHPEFKEKYIARYNKDPGLFAVYVYTDFELLKYAIEKVGESPEGITNFIKNLKTFKGTYEQVEITKDGDIIIDIVVKRWGE